MKNVLMPPQSTHLGPRDAVHVLQLAPQHLVLVVVNDRVDERVEGQHVDEADLQVGEAPEKFLPSSETVLKNEYRIRVLNRKTTVN